MTEENKPVQNPENGGDAVHTGEGSTDSSNFQPAIDAHQAGASEAYGEGSIQILQTDVKKMNVDLNAKIDKVHESLSADILGLGEVLYETKRRMSIKKKSLS